MIEDTATWINGKHSVTFGGTFVQADVWLENQTLVPTANFGLRLDRAGDGDVQRGQFPGRVGDRLTQAQNLYAMLTGRITSAAPATRASTKPATSTCRSGSRAPRAACASSTSMRPTRWRATPTLTISAGLRYVLQKPFYPMNNSYTTITEAGLYGLSGVDNLFKPGTLTGAKSRASTQYPGGHVRLQHRHATTSRRASGSRGSCRRSRTGSAG